ncbi:hypothetical protein ABGB09_06060 [Streptomyces sp. B8F3]|uniref:hypothetical protein n=1 Tax=Streptomyces sp. B8F3 TaxID=3153573 RepID=UPI00325F4E7A
MRKLIVGGISVLAVSTALLAGTGSAQAETAQVTGQPSGVSIVDTASPAQAAGWEYVDWYFSFNNCNVAAGELSVREGVTTKCEPQTSGLWYLYALR